MSATVAHREDTQTEPEPILQNAGGGFTSNFLATLACLCMHRYGTLASRSQNVKAVLTMAREGASGFTKQTAAKCLLRCHDHRGNIKRSDRPSGIILAPGCCYLGRPENPPEHWAEYPPPGAHARKAWPCDTSAGGAASQIYLGNQSEPGASPNPAGESSAFLPVIAPRFITDGVNENTDIFFCNTQDFNDKHTPLQKKKIYQDLHLFIQTQGLR